MSKEKNKAVEKTNQAKLLSMHMAYPLSKMKPFKKNPRNHEDTIDLLVRSLGIFGAIAPIVLREDGTIAAGHARYKASKKQGRKTFPAIKVRFVDEEAFIAYVMTDNQIATRSTWISAEFGELHDQLDAAGWVPEDTGFDPDMIPAIRAADLGLGSTSTKDPDDVPAPPKKAKSKLGDLYILGDHRLLCGDATKAEDVDRLMDGAKADMVFTDPPYGNDLGYGRGQLGERFIVNDESVQTFCDSIVTTVGILKDKTHALYFCQWRTYSSVEKTMLENGYKIRSVIVWDKTNAGLSGGGLAEQHEWLIVGIKGKARQRFYCGNLWSISRGVEKRIDSLHPHKKPVELLSKGIDLCVETAAIVVDPFLGSGTTLIACEQLGRKCFGMEIEPLYCDVIVKRWETFTGKKAKRVRRKRG